MKKVSCLFVLVALSSCLSACATTKPVTKSTEYSVAVNETAKPIVPAPAHYVARPARPLKVAQPTKLVLVKNKVKRGKQLEGKKAVRYANYKAMEKPNTDDYFNSIMTFNFVPGALYQIYCAPLDVTDIAFQPGEKIVSVAAGDTLRWQVSKTYSGSGDRYRQHLLIKPTEPNLMNSLVVTTDDRTYHLQLHSTQSTYMAVVKWRYPGQTNFIKYYGGASKASAPEQVNINDLNFKYRVKLINGPMPGWMPKMAFNDGNKTYIEFPRNMQQAPILFIGHSGDTDQIVNYRVEGNYYVIDRVVNQVQLRLGQANPSVVQISCAQ